MKTENTFDSLGLSSYSLDAIKKKGFTTPSEIQAKIIPLVFENKHDIIGVSQTGSGKTAGFGLPILDMITPNNKTPKVIILTPTRELALQVSSEMKTFKGKTPCKVLTVYGGTAISNQIKELKRGIDIVVGTPGRVLDLIDRKSLRLSDIEYFVLDEGDEMLRMGFIEDIEQIFEATPKSRRVLLFSATMPEKIKKLSQKYMKKQLIVEIKPQFESKANIKQQYFITKREEKLDILCRIIDFEDFFYGIVFCMTRDDVNELTSQLKKAGYDADCIHGEIPQNKREKILKKFRDLKINILVATDVAARGIDVNDLTHVINHSIPKETESYVHRIGRTGRAGKSGTAISFLSSKQKFLIRELERATKGTLERGILPNAKDIASKKNIILKKEIEKTISTGNHNEYVGFASELIQEFGAENVLSSLLAKLTKKEVIKEEKPNKKVRLFIAKGKDNKFDKRMLFNFLEKESGIRIDGESVKINGKFSFMNVPCDQAEKILRAFGRRKGRPLVEEASEKQ